MKKCLDCGAEKSRKGNYCKKCSYRYRIRPKGLTYVKHKENPTSFKKGIVPWNKGVPSKFKKINPGYDAIHEWVERWFGKPLTCIKCGSCNNVEWANKTGKYDRSEKDWLRLCRKCHCRYDFKHFGARKSFYT